MLTALEQTTYLGPASVLKVAGDRLQLELPDQTIWARTALASPYQPVAGDSVLVINNGSDWYVIGLLKGSGMTTITVPGDLSLAAPRGAITLRAGRGLKIQSPKVRVVTRQWSVLAERAVERFQSAAREVEKTFRLRVGEFLHRVRGAYRVRAGRIVETAREEVAIDGKKINLG